MLEFKPITRNDLDELTKMYIETFNAEPWNDQWTEETAGRRLRQMIRREGFCGVSARLDGVLCGMILGFQEQYFDGIVFEIKEFCVKNSIRGKGIGSGILSYFESQLNERNIKRILLLTSRGEQTEQFYKKHGYEACDDMVLMDKPGRGF